jgi:hypothetical protein
LSFSYWIDNLGFITEGKLAAIFIKPSLGISNWPVIYFINYTPTSFLAPSSPRHHLLVFVLVCYACCGEVCGLFVLLCLFRYLLPTLDSDHTGFPEEGKIFKYQKEDQG